MNARSAALITGAILLTGVALLGQSRSTRTTEARRNQPAAEPPSTIPPTAAPPTPAGKVTPPNQGYVVMPESAPAGSVASTAIPADPLDRAYWEMYDRQRPITLTGKVTRVDWTMPNSYIFMAAGGGLWAVESGYIHFRQSSVTPAVRVDETITITGYFPREGSGGELPAWKSSAISTYLRTNHLVRAGEITTVYGQKLTLGRPPSDQEMAERLRCTAFGC
jgi:hypothetical protein